MERAKSPVEEEEVGPMPPKRKAEEEENDNADDEEDDDEDDDDGEEEDRTPISHEIVLKDHTKVSVVMHRRHLCADSPVPPLEAHTSPYPPSPSSPPAHA